MGNENRSAGEFHTPRPVIQFMVDVIDPQIGEEIYDPASGSCGFLAQTYLYMAPKARTLEERDYLQRHTIYGQDRKGISFLLSIMNIMLHRVTSANMTRTNALDKSLKGNVDNQYDIILSNPPFDGTERRHIQQNSLVQSTATELPFIQQIIKKLKRTPNARAAMVVPEGLLFRGGVFAEVKKDLLEQFHLFAVISLPPGTFAPYSDVKTALLFFQRPDEVLAHNPAARNETWYYQMALPKGLKRYSKSIPIQDTHFDEARAMWQQWRTYLNGESERPFAYAADRRAQWQAYLEQEEDSAALRLDCSTTSWVETLDDLKAYGYDLSAHNPNQGSRMCLPHPTEITARLLERAQEFQNILLNLHELLSKNGY